MECKRKVKNKIILTDVTNKQFPIDCIKDSKQKGLEHL